MDRAISLGLRRIDLAVELPFQIGPARIDPPAHEINWADQCRRVQPQTLKVLVALHDKIGEVVTRDELVDRCWDGRFVGEDVINRCISLLRRVAAESGGIDIQTVPRGGYRLFEIASSTGSGRKPRWIVAAAVLAVGIVGVAGWTWLEPQPSSQGMPPTPSISIIPFTVESNDLLAKQVAAAAPVSIEHMMAESGFATMRSDPVAANAAQSDYVFTGNIRRAQTSIDATVQLIARRDGTIVYAHDFSAPIDRAAELPDRIGATAVTELGWTGAAMILDPGEHLSPQVRSELMSATVLIIEEDGGLRAYQLVRHAATAAPDSAFAQLSLAVVTRGAISSIPLAQRGEALALGRRASDRARALAPQFGDVYLTWCLLHSKVRMTECDAHLRHALEIDARSSSVPGFLSFLSQDAGSMDEALRLARQSLANDPYRPAKLEQMIRMLELSGDSDEAEQLYRMASRIWPDHDGMRGNLLLGVAESGDYARLATLSTPRLGGPMRDPPAFTALLAAQRKHDVAGAERACGARVLSRFTLGLCMNILADLGDLDRSYAIAKSLYPASQAPSGEDEDRFWLDHPGGFEMAFLTGPAGKAMRTDPRFLGLAQKLGLLDYWRSGRLPDFCTKGHEPVCARIISKRR